MRAALSLGLTALMVGIFLAGMVGMFWVLDILPALAFLGLAVVYALLSSARPASRPPQDARPQIAKITKKG
ncbi:MAG: hypothetical protein K6U14_06375 [Firmicutes bacterium]|nr:hypothetical protein [Alicyclobacillaceae bacterium]MCL6497245.1 hypothetical protein [Bacillota bacterium]